jgi:hypothetical protein
VHKIVAILPEFEANGREQFAPFHPSRGNFTDRLKEEEEEAAAVGANLL